MKIRTRKAIDSDIDKIVCLWRRFMIEQGSSDYSEVEGNWTDRLKDQIADSKVIVADNENTIIGFVGFIDSNDRDWIPNEIAYVVDIYVAPEARVSTAARSLFNEVGKLLNLSYSETWTNTHIDNKRMQILLERAGFKELTEFKIEGLKDHKYYKRDNKRVETNRG